MFSGRGVDLSVAGLRGISKVIEGHRLMKRSVISVSFTVALCRSHHLSLN